VVSASKEPVRPACWIERPAESDSRIAARVEAPCVSQADTDRALRGPLPRAQPAVPAKTRSRVLGRQQNSPRSSRRRSPKALAYFRGSLATSRSESPADRTPFASTPSRQATFGQLTSLVRHRQHPLHPGQPRNRHHTQLHPAPGRRQRRRPGSRPSRSPLTRLRKAGSKLGQNVGDYLRGRAGSAADPTCCLCRRQVRVPMCVQACLRQLHLAAARCKRRSSSLQDISISRS
jgi:hypothetical protein